MGVSFIVFIISIELQYLLVPAVLPLVKYYYYYYYNHEVVKLARYSGELMETIFF